MSMAIRPFLDDNRVEFEARIRQRRDQFFAGALLGRSLVCCCSDTQHVTEERDKVQQARLKLREIGERVQRRPFLFQLAQQEAALKRAQEKFRKTLVESGLNPSDFEDSENDRP
jgi:hypothetical protein